MQRDGRDLAVGGIRFVGVGTAGGNFLDAMIRLGLDRRAAVAMNTGKEELANCRAGTRLLLGETVTKGNGAGGRPSIGRQAAEESRDAIRNALAGMADVMVLAGISGGTGGGATPIIARFARESGIRMAGLFAFPFEWEGERRIRNANECLSELHRTMALVSVIPPSALLKNVSTRAESLPYAKGLELIDDLVARFAMRTADSLFPSIPAEEERIR